MVGDHRLPDLVAELLGKPDLAAGLRHQVGKHLLHLHVEELRAVTRCDARTVLDAWCDAERQVRGRVEEDVESNATKGVGQWRLAEHVVPVGEVRVVRAGLESVGKLAGREADGCADCFPRVVNERNRSEPLHRVDALADRLAKAVDVAVLPRHDVSFALLGHGGGDGASDVRAHTDDVGSSLQNAAAHVRIWLALLGGTESVRDDVEEQLLDDRWVVTARLRLDLFELLVGDGALATSLHKLTAELGELVCLELLVFPAHGLPLSMSLLYSSRASAIAGISLPLKMLESS